MSLNDLMAEQNEALAHLYRFCLWPKMWKQYADNVHWSLNWQVYPFQDNESDKIPSQPGVYSFIIEPCIADHPHCSYLMYVGKTKSLKNRFRRYFQEKRTEKGRPKIIRLLNNYEDHLFFCCATLDSELNLAEIEFDLIGAFVPPCNDQLPARLSKIVGAFA
jgi:hypothetical protein